MSLTTIARDMRAYAAHHGVAKHRLRRGLLISLHHDDRGRKLIIGRRDVAPSDREEAIIRRSFGVPEGAAREQQRLTVDRGKAFGIITLSWMEHPIPTQPPLSNRQ